MTDRHEAKAREIADQIGLDDFISMDDAGVVSVDGPTQIIAAALRQTEAAHQGEGSPDHRVEAVRQKLLKRSEVGLKKYGVTTDALGLLEALKHAQEEAMDLAVYIEAALAKLSVCSTGDDDE